MDESLIYRVPAQPKNPLEDFVKEEEPSQIFSAMPEKSVETPKTGIAYQEPTLQKKSSNPLENLPEVEKTQTEESDEPPSIGKIVAGGHDLISKIKYAQAGRTGRNAREVAREKALDNQAIFQVYSAMQNRLSERGYDPRLVDFLGTNKGGGFRSAEDIDRLFKIKEKGLQYQTKDGNIVKLGANAPWNAIVDAADEAGGITITKPSDPLKDYGDAINTAKGLYEAADKDPDNAERYRKEANAVIKSFVPPQVRQQMYVANQEDIFTGVNPQSWSDGTRNYKGVAISKDMPDEEKVTTAERFNKLAGSAFPAISGKVVGDGLDVGDDAIARTSAWFEQNGLPVPEGNFFAGVTIKTNKGVEAYPVQLNLKTGEIIPMVNLPQPVTTEKATAPAPAADPLSSPSDAGLSLRRAVKKGVESVDKAGIAAALGLANIGPGLANISADIYEAGESFSTGKPATKLPRYKLYDGGDVEERYEAQKKRNANKVKAGFDEFFSEEPNNAYDLPNDEYNDVLKFASVYSGEPVKLLKVEGAKEQWDAFTSDKHEKLQAKGLQAVKTSKGVFFVDRSDSQSRADDLENLIKRATNPDTVGDLTNREREILSRWKFERARRGRGLAEGVVETADGLSRLVNDGKELDEFWTGKKAVYEYKGDDFNNPYNFIKAMRSGDKNK